MSETTVLAFDPSSTCTGWAAGVIHGKDVWPEHGGLLKPPAKADSKMKRIEWMVRSVFDLVTKFKPANVVIEIPGGKQHGSIKGRASGLTIYGMAAGAIWCAVFMHPHKCVLEAAETTWTTGQGSKTTRAQRALMLWPPYKDIKDSGNDLSDAICLLDWYGRRLWRESLTTLYDRR